VLFVDVLPADVSADVGIHASIVLSNLFSQAQLPKLVSNLETPTTVDARGSGVVAAAM